MSRVAYRQSLSPLYDTAHVGSKKIEEESFTFTVDFIAQRLLYSRFESRRIRTNLAARLQI